MFYIVVMLEYSMVQIHIDTDKDSKQTLKKVITFLQQFIDETPQWPNTPSRPEPAYNPQPYMERPTPHPAEPSPDMFSMFQSNTATDTPAYPSTTSQSSPSTSASSLLDDTDDDEEGDSPSPQLMPY